ncbi:olfactory receptor 14A16-like [Emydura macquarii macquarii]|uniref:olfactory receptor 14A16-like n=1 Tax=Emydura macquarii macquarii TaxID=1129001 RepID=UPI00352B8B22
MATSKASFQDRRSREYVAMGSKRGLINMARHNVLRKKTSNRTTVTEFLLLGFSEVRELQILHVVVFLVVYLAALMGNLLIITAIALDHHLHTPMFISYAGCVTQVFFFFFFVGADFFLLTIMAYDRYIAICQPLHYERVMNRGACVQMAAGAWASGVLISTLHTGNMLAISFCRDNMVDPFFCDIPQLLKLTWSDSYLTETGIILFRAGLALCCFVFITASYVQIISRVLRIPSEQGRHKAFSTCLPHFTVLSLLVCTGGFAYLKPPSSTTSWLDLVVAVFYSVLPPVMNPIIYSMRNKEIKASLRKLTGWWLSTKN